MLSLHRWMPEISITSLNKKTRELNEKQEWSEEQIIRRKLIHLNDWSTISDVLNSLSVSSTFNVTLVKLFNAMSSYNYKKTIMIMTGSIQSPIIFLSLRNVFSYFHQIFFHMYSIIFAMFRLNTFSSRPLILRSSIRYLWIQCHDSSNEQRFDDERKYKQDFMICDLNLLKFFKGSIPKLLIVFATFLTIRATV